MKHIYKLSIVLLFVGTYIGCSVDDDEQITVLPQKELTASLDNQKSIIGVPDNTTRYDLVVSFSDELPSYSTIEYSLDGGSPASSSASSGSSSITIPITFAADENFHDIELTDFIVVNALARRYTPSIVGNTSVRIMRQGYFSAKMTWETSQDLDLYLDVMTASWSWSGISVDGSFGITNQEEVSGMLDDGNYSFYVYEWPTSSFSQPVDITFETTTAGGNFSFTIDEAQEYGWLLWFTKNTDSNGNVSYTFYTDDPS